MAVIGWKLRRKERGYGVDSSVARGPAYGPRRIAEAPRWDDDAPRRIAEAPRWDDDAPRRDDEAARWDEDASEWDDDAPRWDEDSPGRDDRRSDKAGKPQGRFLGQLRGQRAEVEINPGKCMRFAFCEHEAPEIFKLQGDRIDYKPSVPADQIDAVAMAVKVCPARAIKMKMPGSKPYLPQPPVDDDERRPVRR